MKTEKYNKYDRNNNFYNLKTRKIGKITKYIN